MARNCRSEDQSSVDLERENSKTQNHKLISANWETIKLFYCWRKRKKAKNKEGSQMLVSLSSPHRSASGQKMYNFSVNVQHERNIWSASRKFPRKIKKFASRGQKGRLQSLLSGDCEDDEKDAKTHHPLSRRCVLWKIRLKYTSYLW